MVARSAGGREVAGSNPVTPRKINTSKRKEVDGMQRKVAVVNMPTVFADVAVNMKQVEGQTAGCKKIRRIKSDRIKGYIRRGMYEKDRIGWWNWTSIHCGILS